MVVKSLKEEANLRLRMAIREAGAQSTKLVALAGENALLPGAQTKLQVDSSVVSKAHAARKHFQKCLDLEDKSTVGGHKLLVLNLSSSSEVSETETIER
eukprot:2011976-Amphidinium_carterae.3